jgi:kinesin family protein C2/C3
MHTPLHSQLMFQSPTPQSSARLKSETDSALVAATLLASSNGTPAQHQAQRNAMQHTLMDQQQAIEALRLRMADRDEQLLKAQRQLFATEMEREALKTSLAESNTALTTLKESMASMAGSGFSQISELQAKLQGLSQQLMTAHDQVIKSDQAYTKAQADGQRKLDESTGKVNALSERAVALARDLDQKELELTERDRQVKDLVMTIQALTHEKNGLQERVQALSVEHEAHRKQRAEQVVATLQSKVIQPIVQVKHEYDAFRAEMVGSWQEMGGMINSFAPTLQRLLDQNQKLTGQYTKERDMRKKLQNELIELRGNIRVFARARPPKEASDSVMEFTSESELVRP